METEKTPPLRIPPEALPPDTLVRLIEEFVTREGTDYGPGEFSLSSKINEVGLQLSSGEAVIIYDHALESVNIVTRRVAETLLADDQ